MMNQKTVTGVGIFFSLLMNSTAKVQGQAPPESLGPRLRKAISSPYTAQTRPRELPARPNDIDTAVNGLLSRPDAAFSLWHRVQTFHHKNHIQERQGQIRKADGNIRTMKTRNPVLDNARHDPCPLQCACTTDLKKRRGRLSVSCVKANFTQIPSFPKASSSIEIRGSSVYHIQENAFGGLSELVRLRVESHVPWTVSAAAFSNLKTLSSLYLWGHSPDAKPFPPDVFKDVRTLTSIAVQRFPIDVKSQILCPIRSISYLVLNNNGLKNLKFGNCFLHFERLSVLTISNNPLTNIGKSDLDNLINSPISVLHIVNGRLKTLEVDIFRLFPSLTTVSVSNNQLHALSVPKINTNVVNLEIVGNSFLQLPCDTLSKMPKLVELASSRNSHMNVTLCDTLKSLTSLAVIRLDGTPINFIGAEFFKVLETATIKSLTLSARNISSKAFRYLQYLEYLKLSNYLSLQALTEGLTSLARTNISALEIQGTKPLNILLNNTFNSLKNTKLKTLVINNCRIRGVSKSTFAVLRSLVELNLHDNEISYLPAGVFGGLFSLRTIDLSKNNILTWGDGTIPWGIEPNIERINLSWNSIKTIPNQLSRQPLKLSEISFAHNQIKTIAANAFQGTQLTSLILSYNFISKLQIGLLDSCKSLQHLDLSSNNIQFDDSMLYNPFEKLTMIKYISISAASFPPQYPQLGNIFQNLNQLTFLTLSNCGLGSLPVTMFENTTNIESLILSRNSIVSWNKELFKPFQKLSMLILARNKITNVNKASFIHLAFLRRLDLSYNALVCNCDLLWFRSWITNVYIYLDHIQERGMYVCAAPDAEKGTELLYFNLSEDDCVDKTMLKLSISLSVSVVFLACLALTAYKYRFHLYYVFFYVRYRRRRLREAEDTTNYVYDAFVAYNAEDRAWVINQLLPELEFERGYKICLHHRDWLAGKDIVDNIVTSIESSRKVILVLSNKFASSHWCQVKATMSQTRMLDGGRNPLILLLLEDIRSRNMTSTLRYLMTSQTYLPWSNEEHDQEVFWRRLAAAMKGPRGRRGILYMAAQEEGNAAEDDNA